MDKIRKLLGCRQRKQFRQPEDFMRDMVIEQRKVGWTGRENLDKCPYYSSAFGNGPRNFEPWSGYEDDTLAEITLS
ncbi:hypothetical protein TNCV_4069611 [Trichonephila clavipes]|nr:hypothetical protein TNCV_4069611 [Trichonephila clavipes]